MSAPSPEFLTPESIAELLGVSYHGVLRDIRSRKLRATKKGKGYHIRRDWFDEWIEADIVDPPTTPTPSPTPTRRGPAPVGSVADLDAIEHEEQAA